MRILPFLLLCAYGADSTCPCSARWHIEVYDAAFRKRVSHENDFKGVDDVGKADNYKIDYVNDGEAYERAINRISRHIDVNAVKSAILESLKPEYGHLREDLSGSVYEDVASLLRSLNRTEQNQQNGEANGKSGGFK